MKKILVFLITIFTFISCYSQDVTIEDFTTGTTLNSADYLPYWQSGVTKKISITNFNTWLNGTTRTIGGTWTFSNTITGAITGNAGTVTNGVYTTGSYSNPSWLSNLALSKINVSAEDPADVLMVSSVGTLVAYPFTGDVTISDIGVTTIGASKVTSGMILNGTVTSSDIASGTITGTNILDGTITNDDINSGAVISYTKLNLTNNIVDSDISTTAAITLSKIEAGTEGQIVVANETFGVPAYKTMSGDATINFNGAVDLADALSDNFSYTGSASYVPETFTPTGTTTISVAGVKTIYCDLASNSATITDFTGASDGQEIIVINSHLSSFDMLIDHGAEINCNGQADATLNAGETMMLIYVSALDMWYQVGK